MPKLSDILGSTIQAEVPIGDETIRMRFRTNFYTPARRAEIEAAGTVPEQIEVQIRTMAEAITEWDLEDDDGAPVPIAEETLSGLGINVLNLMFNAMIGGVFPSPKAASS